MNTLPPDLLKIAERAIDTGASLDYQGRIEIVAQALQAERDRCADAIKALARSVRRGIPT